MWGDLIATNTGQTVVVHPADECLPPCPVHAPSDHPLARAPLHWRGDRRIMERVCAHGIGHPDPDDLSVRVGQDDAAHGCDGCCRSPAT